LTILYGIIGAGRSYNTWRGIKKETLDALCKTLGAGDLFEYVQTRQKPKKKIKEKHS